MRLWAAIMSQWFLPRNTKKMALLSLEVGSIVNSERFFVIILGLVQKKKATILKVTVLLMMIDIIPQELRSCCWTCLHTILCFWPPYRQMHCTAAWYTPSQSVGGIQWLIFPYGKKKGKSPEDSQKSQDSTGRLRQVSLSSRQPGLCNEFQSSQSYILYLKKYLFMTVCIHVCLCVDLCMWM